MDRRKSFVWIVVVALCLGLLLGACGEDEAGGDVAGGGDLDAFCAAAVSIDTAGAEPEPDIIRSFNDGLDENAPPEIKDDVAVLVQWFGEVMDKYEDDPNAHCRRTTSQTRLRKPRLTSRPT